MPRGLEGEWRVLLTRHGFALGTVSYYVHTRILLLESCVIHTRVLVPATGMCTIPVDLDSGRQ